MYKRISTILEPDRCALVAIENSGSTIMICGMLIAVTKPLLITTFPLNTNLASTYAAGALIRIDPTVA